MKNIRLWTDKSLKKVPAVLMLPQNQLLIFWRGGEGGDAFWSRQNPGFLAK